MPRCSPRAVLLVAIAFMSWGSSRISFAKAVGRGAQPAKQIVYIQPLGRSLPRASVVMVKRAIETFLGVIVKVFPRVPLPPNAFYRPRRRYRGEKLLDYLQGRMPSDGLRILGLTAADISTTKGRYPDWGILGLANLSGTTCVISSFRTKRKAKSALQARQRLAKVAVHELGHTLGLEHCPQKGCLMEGARGKVSTSDGEYDLCGSCRRKLDRAGYRLPNTPKPPWPRPSR